MRKIKLIISIFTLAVLCIHQNVHASISAIAEHEIVRINENMFIGKKRIPYKNRDGSINEEGDDVYFVLEKLTPKNHEFWINYNAEQHRQTLRSGAIADRNDGSGNKKTVSVGDGIGSFKVSLELLPALRSDIWIAYATRKNPTPFPDPGYRDDIPWNESD